MPKSAKSKQPSATTKPVQTPKEANNQVSYQRPEYKEMKKYWDLVNALNDGTAAMQAAGEKYLPRFSNEEQSTYNIRLKNSILFEAYSDTVDGYVAKPFSEPVKVEGVILDKIQEMIDDIDGTKRTLSQFLPTFFEKGIHHGVSYILVDYPTTEFVLDNGDVYNIAPTKADEEKLGLKPVFVHITADQIINWQTSRSAGGEEVLDMVVIKSEEVRPTMSYASEVYDVLTVWRNHIIEVWEKPKDKDETEYQNIATMKNSLGFIPLVPFYTRRIGSMLARPAAERLAWLNLKHFRSDSDQTNILTWIRCPLLYLFGLSQEEMDKPITIGPGRAFKSVNPDAHAGYLEHTGAAASAGERDLKSTEELMELVGMQPLIRSSGDVTATGARIDASKSVCKVQLWVTDLENVVYKAFVIAAQWMKITLPDTFNINIFNNFGIDANTADKEFLLRLRTAKQITHRTLLNEIKRTGVLSEELDVEKEIIELESEFPGAMFGDGDIDNAES